MENLIICACLSLTSGFMLGYAVRQFLTKRACRLLIKRYGEYKEGDKA